ncbi:MAG: glutamyl-tRNA reductase [Proteobacteria bacterium]|nr:glutamyl-tRNA reductase [Pseudomonadota bacterium]
MNIVLVGLNHRTAPVELRERLAMDACAPEQAYHDILNRTDFGESIYLSTCNRVEILAATDDMDEAVTQIKSFLASARGLDVETFEDALYVMETREAVRHVFRVASSLDSMVLGEPQILGQLKAAFREAVDNKATGPILNKLMHKSFSTAKRVRTETGVASHAVSISFAAVELARKIFGDLAGRKVLLVGAGEMAELAAEHLRAQGASDIIVANRTLERAVELASRWRGRAAALGELPALLVEADVVVSSTGAPDVVISAEAVRSVLRARRHRPLFFVDIAVPRDVDPAVNRLDNVYLYDIDDLRSVVEENRAAREEEAVRAERIVDEETIKFLGWMETLEVVPTIVALKDKAEHIRRAELSRTLSKLDSEDPDLRRSIEILTESLTHKLLHDPIMFVKNAGRRPKKDFYLDLTRRIFNLNGEAGPKSGTEEKE